MSLSRSGRPIEGILTMAIGMATGLAVSILAYLILLGLNPLRTERTVVKAFENGSLPVDPASGGLQWKHHCEVAFLSVIWFNGDCALPVPTGQSARVERDCEAMFLGSTYLRSDYYLFAPSLPRDRAGLAQPCEMIRDIVTGDTTVSYERRSARSNPVLLRSFLRLIGASGFTGLGWVLPLVMAAALGLNAVLRLRSVTERSPIAVPFIAAVSVLLIGTTMFSWSSGLAAIVIAAMLSGIAAMHQRLLAVLVTSAAAGAALVLTDYFAGAAIAGFALLSGFAMILFNGRAADIKPWMPVAAYVAGATTAACVNLAAMAMTRQLPVGDAFALIAGALSDLGNLADAADRALLMDRLGRLAGGGSWGEGGLAAAVIILPYVLLALMPLQVERRLSRAPLAVGLPVIIWVVLNPFRLAASAEDYLLPLGILILGAGMAAAVLVRVYLGKGEASGAAINSSAPKES